LQVTRYLEERTCIEMFKNEMLKKFVNENRTDSGDMEVLVT